MLIEWKEPDFIFENEAGYLRQLVHEGYSQVNVVFSKGGAIRGHHHHDYNCELFYVIKGRFDLELSKGEQIELYSMQEGDMFVVPPHVDHVFTYFEDTLLVAMYDHGVEMEDGAKDIVDANAD